MLRVLVIVGALVLLLFAGGVGYFVYAWHHPNSLEVRNETGQPAHVLMGTFQTLDLGPYETGTLRGPLVGELLISSKNSFKQCSWKDAFENQPLIINDDGAQCTDTSP